MKGSKKDSKWIEVRCFCFIFSWSKRERIEWIQLYNPAAGYYVMNSIKVGMQDDLVKFQE
jgi:hypothetical protein